MGTIDTMRRQAVVMGFVVWCGCSSRPQEADGGSLWGGGSGPTGGAAGTITGEGPREQPGTGGPATTTGSLSTTSLATTSGSAVTNTMSTGTLVTTGSTTGLSPTTSTLGATSGTSGGSSSTGEACGKVDLSFEPVVPSVYLLLDRSGSMKEDVGGKTRWQAVGDALFDPTTGVVPPLSSEVRFGLGLYTVTNRDTGPCPLIHEEVPALANFSQLTGLYDHYGPGGGTPTAASFAAVTTTMAEFAEPGPKIIVLATDGEPDTCQDGSPDPIEPVRAEVVQRVEDAFGLGIQTFVISVGDNIVQSHVLDIARAGIGWQVGDPDPTVYAPSDEEDIRAAFDAIINGVRSCVFTLNGEIVPGAEDKGTVRVNGVEIPYNDGNGWRVNSPTEIELLGASCEQIQSGEVTIEGSFPCDAIIPQ